MKPESPRSSAPLSLLILAYAIVSIVWGSTYLGIRIALESYPPFFVAGIRAVIAGAVLFVVARARGEALPTARELGASLSPGSSFS